MSIVIYTKHHCPYCEYAKRLLKDKQLNFEEINVQECQDPDAMIAEMREKTQGKTFPQILIDEEPIGGYNDLVMYFQQINREEHHGD